MTVDIRKFWIEGVLLDAYPRFHEEGGADLDENGRIEDTERLEDLDHNGVVGNQRDYELYLQINRPHLSDRVPFFQWGESLSVQNPFHRIAYLESDLVDPSRIREGYSFVVGLVSGVNTFIGNSHFSEARLSAELESQLYYTLINGTGIVFQETASQSFLSSIHDHEMDCDTSAFVAMAIGHERGLYLHPTIAPRHVFVRGKGVNGVFNVDFGNLRTNDSYSIPPDLLQRGVYLRTFNDQQVESLLLHNRGGVLESLGRYPESLAACDRAIEINPNDPEIHRSRGICLIRLGRNLEALAAYDQAIILNPYFAQAHLGRAVALRRLGRNSEALAAARRSMELDSVQH